MRVTELYPEQFEELRDKVSFCFNESDLEDVGADVELWTEEDCNNFCAGIITDELVIKSFCSYDFGCDDFFCTAGRYEEYPDNI